MRPSRHHNVVSILYAIHYYKIYQTCMAGVRTHYGKDQSLGSVLGMSSSVSYSIDTKWRNQYCHCFSFQIYSAKDSAAIRLVYSTSATISNFRALRKLFVLSFMLLADNLYGLPRKSNWANVLIYWLTI